MAESKSFPPAEEPVIPLVNALAGTVVGISFITRGIRRSMEANNASDAHRDRLWTALAAMALCVQEFNLIANEMSAPGEQ